MDMQEFRDLYIQTARERIQELNGLLLKLEKNPTQSDIVEELMRSGHSLKGESGAMGFTQIATLAHVVEDLFTAIGAGQMTISTEIMNALFEALDHIEQSVNAIEAKADAMDLDSSKIVAKMKEITGLKTEGFGKTEKAVDGKVTVQAPTAPPVSSPAQATVSEKTPAATSEDKKISTITLKVEKLDKLVNISEELILLKMKLKTSKFVDGDTQLKADVHRLDRLVTDLQFHVMQTRLFPISLAFTTLPRLVRDVSQKTQKQVELMMEGEDTTVDRSIIDHLTEPFVHMIRNAIDHGIEAPADREKVGKPAQAQVKITAYTRENKFFVEIADDGRGIEWDKLAAAAVKKGALDEATAQRYLTTDQSQLLFLDGVSTSEVVTDVSGRGVGMSAVERAIKQLGGEVDVQTTVGQGTIFTLKLPMTLAIIQAMLVKLGQQVYAIPSNDIVRSLQVDEVVSTGNALGIVVEKQHVTILELATLFHVANSEATQTQGTVVLIRAEQGMVGLRVDKIIAEEEILVKPLSSLLRRQSRYFSGATILADGTAAPILNLDGLRQMV